MSYRGRGDERLAAGDRHAPVNEPVVAWQRHRCLECTAVRTHGDHHRPRVADLAGTEEDEHSLTVGPDDEPQPPHAVERLDRADRPSARVQREHTGAVAVDAVRNFKGPLGDHPASEWVIHDQDGIELEAVA